MSPNTNPETSTPTQTAPGKIRVFVWDVPTRFFHWGLVTLVAIAWFTGEEEAFLFTIHELAGYGILSFVLFRIFWGLMGSRYSLFKNFVKGPQVILAHLREMATLFPRPNLGHNPVGGWMILALLGVLAGLGLTGLYSSDDGFGGPFAELVSGSTGHMITEWHEGLSTVLLTLIAIHVLGVVVEMILTEDNLIRAMFTGVKIRPLSKEDQDGGRDLPGSNPAPFALALVFVAIALAVGFLPYYL